MQRGKGQPERLADVARMAREARVEHHDAERVHRPTLPALTVPRRSMDRQVTVIGAGIVGTSTALHLQRRGWDVTLVDRRGPGRETSFGNAGVINAGSMVALNNPDIHASLLRLLGNRDASLRIDPRHALRRLPWLLAFLDASKTSAARRTALALHALVSRAPGEHRDLMRLVGNAHRLRATGWLKVYRGGGPERARRSLDGFTGALLRECGVDFETLDADGLRALEPALKPIFGSALHLVDGGVVDDPGALVAEHAALFGAAGGTLLESDVRAIGEDGDGAVWRAADAVHRTGRIVVAAGPWSADLLATADYSVPLDVERGYHAHFGLARESADLSHSVHDVDAGYVMGPMARGLRVTTGVELAPRDAPSNLAQLEAVTPRVAEAVATTGRTEDPVWRGARPTLPDSLPAIGPLPGSARLWANFGHQHVGLMTGPVSGRLCAEMLSGGATVVDPAPYAPARCAVRRRPAHGGRWRGPRLGAGTRPGT